jgi:hypothetical protein
VRFIPELLFVKDRDAFPRFALIVGAFRSQGGHFSVVECGGAVRCHGFVALFQDSREPVGTDALDRDVICANGQPRQRGDSAIPLSQPFELLG